MTWTAPPVERPVRPSDLEERASLEASLDHQRETFRWKCSGLSGEQLARRAVEPSTLSLLGLIRHLADVERWWFRRWLGGEDVELAFSDDADPERDFEGGSAETAEANFAAYLDEVERARAAVAGRSLDDTFTRPRGERANVRWLYLHMIEEYARHNGHADLLRERIDGATGD